MIEDWKANVVNSLGADYDTERLAEYALHVSRILAYPDLDVKVMVDKIDAMGRELVLATKDLMPLRPTQIIEKINHFLFKEKEFRADQLYPGQNIPLTRAFVQKATSAQVIIRMLNNLKGSYYESQDIDKAEIANEMIIAIESHNPDAVRDKGMILLKRKKHLEALDMLNMYLDLDPEAEDADAVLDIIRQVRVEINKK